MKLLKTVVTAVALCAAFVAQARTLDEVKKDGKIIIATEGQFDPFSYFKVAPSPRASKSKWLSWSSRRWA